MMNTSVVSIGVSTKPGQLHTSPAERLAEVEDFVDFLVQKVWWQAAFERLLSVAPALRAAGVEPMSEEEIGGEIDFARAERRAP